MSAMSTPARTPHRLFIPSGDSNFSRQRAEDLLSCGGWETPVSAQDRRRPSLTYSALSEPSLSSQPTTPGHGGSQAADSMSSFHFEDGSHQMRGLSNVKAVPAISQPTHSLGFSSFGSLSAFESKQHGHMPLTAEPESFNVSFVSNGSTEVWDTVQPAGMQHYGQNSVLRPSQIDAADSFSAQDFLDRGIYFDGPAPSLQHNVQACQPNASFESIQSDYLSPHRLIVPSADPEQDMYGYRHHQDSALGSPAEPPSLSSSSFEGVSSFSSWEMGSSSPVDDYSAHDDSAVRTKDESPMPSGHDFLQSPGHDFLQSPDHGSPSCARRARARGKASISKRCRAVTHQLVKNFADVDVAIDPKTMEMDVKTGIISKKKVNVETKRWKCSTPGCQSRSARKEHLRRHELSHLPNKQFHCNLPKCGRAITRSDNLIQHLMTHARPPKPGKRNNHHTRRRIEQMVLDTMTDDKLAQRTITNLGKAIEREQDKWPVVDADMEWTRGSSLNNDNSNDDDADDDDEDTADSLRYEP